MIIFGSEINMPNNSKLANFKGLSNNQIALKLHCSPRTITNWKGQIPGFKQYVRTGNKNAKYVNATGFELLKEKRDGTYAMKQAQRERKHFIAIVRQSIAPISSNQRNYANQLMSAINNLDKSNKISDNSKIAKLEAENQNLRREIQQLRTINGTIGHDVCSEIFSYLTSQSKFTRLQMLMNRHLLWNAIQHASRYK